MTPILVRLTLELNNWSQCDREGGDIIIFSGKWLRCQQSKEIDLREVGGFCKMTVQQGEVFDIFIEYIAAGFLFCQIKTAMSVSPGLDLGARLWGVSEKLMRRLVKALIDIIPEKIHRVVLHPRV